MAEIAKRKAALKRKPGVTIVIGAHPAPPPIGKVAPETQEPDGDEAPKEVECPKCGHCFDPLSAPVSEGEDPEAEANADEDEEAE